MWRRRTLQNLQSFPEPLKNMKQKYYNCSNFAISQIYYVGAIFAKCTQLEFFIGKFQFYKTTLNCQQKEKYLNSEQTRFVPNSFPGLLTDSVGPHWSICRGDPTESVSSPGNEYKCITYPQFMHVLRFFWCSSRVIKLFLLVFFIVFYCFSSVL